MSTGGSVFARLALVFTVGLLGLHVAGYYFYGHERMVDTARTFAVSVAARGYALDQLLHEQPELLPVVQSDTFRIRRVAANTAVPSRDWPHNEEVVGAVHEHLSGLGMPHAKTTRLWFVLRDGPPRLHLILPSVAGGYLDIVAVSPVASLRYGSAGGVMMSLLLLIAIGVVLLLLRRLTRQLGRFVAAAEGLGSGRPVADLPEQVGPGELRRASIAFNHMRRRVQGLLNQRSAMLAGISHDLRTLCTRLGLRLEQIDDDQQRQKAADEIALMTAILDQALTYARDEHSEEAPSRLDLGSLLQGLVDEHVDCEHQVTLTAAEPVIVDAQPTAVARLFSNLLDNAVKYGGRADVTLRHGGVDVRDPGPGIPVEQHQAALQPYVRLDTARSQNQPGSGLGLSIAHNICQRHGWILSFQQTDDGFVARVDFAA